MKKKENEPNYLNERNENFTLEFITISLEEHFDFLVFLRKEEKFSHLNDINFLKEKSEL